MTRARARKTEWGAVKERKRKGGTKYYAMEPIGNGKYRPSPDNPYTSKSDAQKWLRKRELERDSEKALTAAARKDNTFGYWLDLWYGFHKKAWEDGHLSAKGWNSVDMSYRNWIKRITVDGKPLTDISIRKIDATMVKKILLILKSLPAFRVAFSPSQSQRAELNVYSVLKMAADEGAIPKNPFREKGVYVTNETFHRELFELSTDMVTQLADQAPIEYRAPIFLWAYTGLRAGEAWGLQVRDINLLHKRVAITKQLVTTPDHLINDPDHVYGRDEARQPASAIPYGSRIRKGVQLKAPKPKRSKTLDLHGFVADELTAHLERRQPEHPHDWLFVDKKGLPVNHGNWYGYVFKPLCRMLDLPETVDVHTLRHFCGSYHLMLGYPWFVVQTMLDHSNEEMTRLYSHIVPGMAAEFHKRAEAEYEGRKAQ